MRRLKSSWALEWLTGCAVAFLWLPAPALACLADGQVAVSLSLSQMICEISPHHVANAACCSGRASPVWNPGTAKCDTTCDSTDPCVYVTCTALDQCHHVGTCDSATGLCSNPPKTDGICSDGNFCTSGDNCTSGSCIPGTPIADCCGNGSVEAGEQCDDGNQSADVDGCSASCTIDATWACAGQPSACCISRDNIRFTLPGLDQSQCGSIQTVPDAGCCGGFHHAVWTGSVCNVVCTIDLCRENHVTCPPPPGVCFNHDACHPEDGLCYHVAKLTGLSCGDPTVNACSGANTCDGYGNCLANDAAAGTSCSTDPCKVAQCDGAGTCVQLGNVADGQGCDDGNPCTNEQCVSGQCTSSGPVVCQPLDGCHVAGTCDPATGCSNPPAPAGLPCGIPVPTGPCDGGDVCSGDGTCLPNPLPDFSFCGDPGGTCFSPGFCYGDTCFPAEFIPLTAGTPCGVVASQGECDQGDICDNFGNCLSNEIADGSPCGTGDAGDSGCFTAGTCASGFCFGATTEPSGTSCGDTAPLGSCDKADSCDGARHCQRNLLDASTVCRTAAGACDVEEKCDGVHPGCPADAVKPAGTTCSGPAVCNECDSAGDCVECVTATSTTTTTLPEQCAGIAGIARARCLILAALSSQLCDGEPLPAKLDHALRGRLGKAAKQLEAAEKSEGKTRVRRLKKARGAMTAVDRKAAAALKSKKPSKRISSACDDQIGGLVDVVEAELS